MAWNKDNLKKRLEREAQASIKEGRDPLPYLNAVMQLDTWEAEAPPDQAMTLCPDFFGEEPKFDLSKPFVREAGAILQAATGTLYRLDKRLGAGRYGEVWRVDIVSHQPYEDIDAEDKPLIKRAAVKFLNDGLEQKDIKQYWGELDTLEAMRAFERSNSLRKEGHSLLPDKFDRNEASANDGINFFTMTYAQGEKLDELLREKGYLAEFDALTIIEQFCRVLMCLHEGTGQTCLDFQPGNIFWNESEGRIIVIDWNLLDKGMEGRDLRATVGLLYRMTMGVGVPAGNSMRELAQPVERWEQLSFGLRDLMIRGLHRSAERPFVTARDLRDEVLKLLALWQTAPVELMNLAEQKASNFSKLTGTEVLTDSQRKSLQEAAALFSIARNRVDTPLEVKDKFEQLERDLRPVLEGRFDLETGRRFFTALYIEEAIRSFERASKTTWRTDVAQQAERWKIAVSAAQSIISANQKPDREAIGAALDNMASGTKANFETAATSLSKLGEIRGGNGFVALASEARCQIARLDAEFEASRKSYQDAQNHYEAALKYLSSAPQLAAFNPGLETELKKAVEVQKTLAEKWQKEAGALANVRSAPTHGQRMKLIRDVFDADPMDKDLIGETILLGEKEALKGEYANAIELADIGNTFAVGEQADALRALKIASQKLEDARDAWRSNRDDDLESALNSEWFENSITKELRSAFVTSAFDEAERGNDFFRAKVIARHERTGKLSQRLSSMKTILREKAGSLTPENGVETGQRLLGWLTLHPEDEDVISWIKETIKGLVREDRFNEAASLASKATEKNSQFNALATNAQQLANKKADYDKACQLRDAAIATKFGERAWSIWREEKRRADALELAYIAIKKDFE